MLVVLNEYLFSKKSNIEFILPKKYEIEHIMPRSGQNISQIQVDAGMENKDEFLDTVNKLGNKILLEENINRSIGNAWFRTKIQNSVKDKKGYKDSSFALASSIVKTYSNIANPIWTKDDIKMMTEKIAERITEFIFDVN